MATTRVLRVPRRKLRLIAATVGLCTLVLAGVAGSPAYAAGNLDTDNVTLDGGAADFGNNPHLFGSPSQPGTVSWSGASLTGPITARVQGLLYHDDLFTGRCVRIRVTWERSDLSDLSTSTRSLCRTTGGLAARSIDLSLTSTEARFVFVSVQVQQADGTWRVNGPSPTIRVAFLD